MAADLPGLHFDFLEPFARTVPLIVLDETFEVPENNSLLRCLQVLELTTGRVEFDYSNLCWNGECRNCACQYRETPDGTVFESLACSTTVRSGLILVRLPVPVRLRPAPDR